MSCGCKKRNQEQPVVVPQPPKTVTINNVQTPVVTQPAPQSNNR